MFAWGEYNRALGWQPVYLAARSATGEITAMMLGLLRRYPLGVGLLWCAGGPVGDLSEFGARFLSNSDGNDQTQTALLPFSMRPRTKYQRRSRAQRSRLDAFVVYNAFELDDGTRPRC